MSFKKAVIDLTLGGQHVQINFDNGINIFMPGKDGTTTFYHNLNRPQTIAAFDLNDPNVIYWHNYMEKKKAEKGTTIPTYPQLSELPKSYSTPPDFSPKKGDRYNSFVTPILSGNYSKDHSLRGGAGYKYGYYCWADKEILAIPDSNKVAFVCDEVNNEVNSRTPLIINGIKRFPSCQTETGQFIYFNDVSRKENISGSLELLNQDGTIVGLAALPTTPETEEKNTDNFNLLTLTKDNIAFLFVNSLHANAGVRAYKVDFNTGTTQLVDQPYYIDGTRSKNDCNPLR